MLATEAGSMRKGLEVVIAMKADSVLFGRVGVNEGRYRWRRSAQEVVCDAGGEKTTTENGCNL